MRAPTHHTAHRTLQEGSDRVFPWWIAARPRLQISQNTAPEAAPVTTIREISLACTAAGNRVIAAITAPMHAPEQRADHQLTRSKCRAKRNSGSPNAITAPVEKKKKTGTNPSIPTMSGLRPNGVVAAPMSAGTRALAANAITVAEACRTTGLRSLAAAISSCSFYKLRHLPSPQQFVGKILNPAASYVWRLLGG